MDGWAAWLAGLGAVAVAGVLASAFLWARLAAARQEAAGHAAEAAQGRTAAAGLAEVQARAAGLQAELAAAHSRLEERERAHADTLAERERAYLARSAERDALFRQQLDEMQGQFQRLAGEALERAQRQFTEQAGETLKLHRSEAARGVGDLIGPMRETLLRYEAELKAIEGKREQAYGSLAEQLQALARSEQAVRDEAGRIVAALRGSARASGAWGEAQLQRVLELAGLTQGIDFELQASETDSDGRRQRPDAILKLPGGRELVVDAKCALDDHVAASEAPCDDSRAQARQRHARRVREHVKSLASRAYWDQFARAADFVIMFLPGENFLSAALEADPDLHLWALEQKVLLAGPTNLLAIARVVAMVWRQEKATEEARTIGKLGAELYERLARLTEHANGVGRNLEQAARAWNEFVGSYESRVLVTGRKLEALGVAQKPGELATPRLVESSLRLVQAPEARRLDGS